MKDNPEKESLRRLLLERRDNTSFDLMKIASERIQKRLRKIYAFKNAQKIGAYYPIGGEILTQDIIQGLLSQGREVFLPKTGEGRMEFRRILGFSSLEMGSFGIMEPKDSCDADNELDVILVPTVAVTPTGVRLGYGHGYYDKFLADNKTVTISLTLEKQVVKKIPKSDHDIIIDWVVTENRTLQTKNIDKNNFSK